MKNKIFALAVVLMSIMCISCGSKTVYEGLEPPESVTKTFSITITNNSDVPLVINSVEGVQCSCYYVKDNGDHYWQSWCEPINDQYTVPITVNKTIPAGSYDRITGSFTLPRGFSSYNVFRINCYCQSNGSTIIPLIGTIGNETVTIHTVNYDSWNELNISNAALLVRYNGRDINMDNCRLKLVKTDNDEYVLCVVQ